MIFVVEATCRRSCAFRAQSTRPVFPSTSTAAEARSAGANVWRSREPPTRSCSGTAAAIGFFAAAG
jgi:hypothetical protein